MSNKYRKKKERMFAENPRCRRCGVLMWLPASGDKTGTKNLTKQQFDTMATVGHKYSRFDERRYTEPGSKKRYELICHKCNNDEAKEEVKKIPLEKQWEISRAYPQGHSLAKNNELNKYWKDSPF